MHAVPIRQTPYSAPYENPVGWDRLNHNYWIRGHLLHGKSSGPGALWNLTPIPKSTNASMYSGHEEQLFNVVLNKPPATRPLYWYRASVAYYSAGDPRVDLRIGTPSDFPKLITISYGQAKLKAEGTFDELGAIVTKTYNVDPPTAAERDLVKGK
jgi:hypothetical protein